MPRCDGVFEGGGVKGAALVGALEVFDEHGYTFARVGGTSAGAIVAAWLAGGMPVSRMVQIMRTVDYRSLADKAWEDRGPGIGILVSLLKDSGYYEGNVLRDWVAAELRTCGESGIETFGQLKSDDWPDSTPPEKRYRLVVMASDLSARRLRKLPWDYAKLGLNPDEVAVADAVRASASMPGVFEPVDIPHPDGGKTRLMDGGLLSNFPIEVFDRIDGELPRWPTIGFKLSTRADGQRRRNVDSACSTGLAVLQTLLTASDGAHIDDDAVADRTVFIDSLGISPAHFAITPQQVEALYLSGRRAAEKFLSTWDFDAYIEKHRTPEALARRAQLVADRRARLPRRGRASTPSVPRTRHVAGGSVPAPRGAGTTPTEGGPARRGGPGVG